jgi:hypothetical protein
MKVPGRKCKIREIENSVANEFLTKNHIQGYVLSTIHIGAFFNEKLVGVMSLKRERCGSDKWELTRFASDNDCICQGVGGKMFAYFVKNYNPSYIKSFADRRWTIDLDDNLYTKIGFKYDGLLKPEYRYIRKGSYKREHKFNYRKKLLHDRYGLPLNLTESEMCTKIGVHKIWDCGLVRYVWVK